MENEKTEYVVERMNNGEREWWIGNHDNPEDEWSDVDTDAVWMTEGNAEQVADEVGGSVTHFD